MTHQICRNIDDNNIELCDSFISDMSYVQDNKKLYFFSNDISTYYQAIIDNKLCIVINDTVCQQENALSFDQYYQKCNLYNNLYNNIDNNINNNIDQYTFKSLQSKTTIHNCIVNNNLFVISKHNKYNHTYYSCSQPGFIFEVITNPCYYSSLQYTNKNLTPPIKNYSFGTHTYFN